MVVSKEELEKGALLSDADAAVGRLRAHRDECRTGGQVCKRRGMPLSSWSFGSC